MLLVVDVGNTNTVIGVFDGDNLVSNWRVVTLTERTSDEYGVLIQSLYYSSKINSRDIKDIIVSCVVPPMVGIIDELCEKYFEIRPLYVEPGIKTGMPIYYDNPKEVGADRIVNAVAAYNRRKGAQIIVDFGTATTFDYVNESGEYVGGVIAPGLMTSSEALFAKASRLFKVELVRPKTVIGKNTINSLQSGIVLGYVDMVDGLVSRIKNEAGGDPWVIATGGLAELIAGESMTIKEVDNFLTLEGLKVIYHLNRT
jgi:type III pantothenate kinase